MDLNTKKLLKFRKEAEGKLSVLKLGYLGA